MLGSSGVTRTFSRLGGTATTTKTAETGGRLAFVKRRRVPSPKLQRSPAPICCRACNEKDTDHSKRGVVIRYRLFETPCCPSIGAHRPGHLDPRSNRRLFFAFVNYR